jgi:tight adherence protein B
VSGTLLTIVAAVLGFLTVAGFGFVLAGDGGDSRVAKRAKAVTRSDEKLVRVQGRAANPQDTRRKQILKTLKEQEREQKKARVTLSARLMQAGLGDNLRNFWLASGAVAIIVLLAALFLRQSLLVAAGLAFAAGLGAPRWVVGFLAKRRAKKFTESFSDAMDIIVRGIKSGLPVHDCLKVIARESPQPLAAEFVSLVENLGMGVSIDQALEKMYRRMPTSEVRFFAIVMSIQQKTGGNLAEALSNLSVVLRSRKMMREKIKAFSSEAIASASIIGSLPPGVVILIMLTSPSYMTTMFTDPRGHLMLLIGGVWMALGIFVMRRMINFKV